MNKIVLIVFSLFVLISCKKDENHLKSNSKKDVNGTEAKVSEKKIGTPKRIGEYISDEKDFFWTPQQSDSSSYWVRVVFENEFAVYQFHGQFIYWFFTNHYYTGTDKIELLWSYKTDCLLDMKFLSNSNGVKKYPKYGDSFCEYSLLNDSVIKVNYKFPEWVKKINETEQDSIFPQFLYLQGKDNP